MRLQPRWAVQTACSLAVLTCQPPQWGTPLEDLAVTNHDALLVALHAALTKHPRTPPLARSFEELVVTIDALLVEGEEPTMAPPPPVVSGGPCKTAADMAAAAAALSSVPAVVTPPN